MALDDIYTTLIMEESRSQHNKGDLENPDYKELGHNPSCGDEITLQIKLDGDVLKDLSYTGEGCAISQASTSIMIDTVRGKTRDEAVHLADTFIGMINGIRRHFQTARSGEMRRASLVYLKKHFGKIV